MDRRRLGFAIRLCVLATLVVCAWVFARRFDFSELRDALVHARLWPIVLATVLQFAVLWCKAACWRVMLAPRYTLRTARLFRYTIAAFAASAVAPARAGEALRLWALRERDHVPVADGAATALGEKLLDAAAMFMLAAPIPWLIPDLPTWVTTAVAGGAALVVIAVLALWLAVGRVTTEPAAARSWLARFVAGLHVLRSPRRALLALAVLVVAWLVDLAMVELVLYAVDATVSPAAAVVILLTINLAILAPTTPAQLGVHEAGALVGLALVHVPPGPAVAFALVYHALQIFPLIAIGLALEWPLVMGSISTDSRSRRTS